MPDINVTVETSPAPSLSFWSSSLPPQTGNAGKLLGTNGASASWTNDPTLSSLRIENGVYPYLQFINTGAPTDKKRLRAYVETSGAAGLARVNDAENVGFPLIYWDVNNNAYFGAPVNVSGVSTVATFLGSPGGANFFGLRLAAADASAAQARTAFVDISNEFGTNAASLWAEVAADGSSNMRLLTTPAGSRSSDRRVERMRVTGDGNLAVGTTSAPSKLTVAGDIRLLTNGNTLWFTDTGGTTPYMVASTNGNFYFTGTTATGASRAIWECTMRSDTSPLRVNVPLKIGANGANIHGVLKATVTHAIGTIAAGGFLELTSTVTGAIAGAMVHVGGGAPNNLILKGYSSTGDTVSVMYHNPSAASVNAGTRSIDLFVTNII